MNCPVCGGTTRVCIAPGRFQCTGSRLVGGVPAGAPGNLGLGPMPVYGDCLTEYEDRGAGDDWMSLALTF